jgi:hypothetical protein
MDTSSKEKKRPVIQVSYLPDLSGIASPGAITRCPEADLDHRKCNIKKKSWRKRKTGPLGKLARFECTVHKGGIFTVYNLGMLPYKRKSLIDTKDSMAQAIIDGASGIKWPEEAKGGLSTFKTQKRHIRFWCQLIGVEPGHTEKNHLQGALIFNISTTKLRDGARRIRAGPTWKCRALVVEGLLRNLGKISLKDLLSQGHELNFWGSPLINERKKFPLIDFTTFQGNRKCPCPTA